MSESPSFSIALVFRRSLTVMIDCRSDRSSLVATINLNYIQSPDASTVLLVGDKGWLEWDLMASTISRGTLAAPGTLQEGGDSTVEVSSLAPTNSHNAPDRNQAYKDEHQLLFDCMAGKTTPAEHGLSAADALVAQYVINGAGQSAETGNVVDVPELHTGGGEKQNARSTKARL
eukprot:SAG31_NODE_4497_length_3186_cov_2.027859_1_plen_174_part_00